MQEQDIQQIVILELQKLIKRIYDSKEVTLKYSPKLVEYIAKNAYDENFGARPIKRYIQNNIESVLAYQIIDGSIQKNHEYEITIFANKFIVSKVK
nr:hypothetical protein [Mycoplasmopsis bovis]